MELTEEELKNEVWKDIKGFENLYMVSNMGRFKSNKTNLLLKPSIRKDGYEYISLYKNGKRKTSAAHRIVANNFLTNIKNKPIVNHINNIRSDNRCINLNFMTHSENTKHSFNSGISKRNKDHQLTVTLNRIIDIYGDNEIIKDVIFDGVDYTGLYKISSKGYIISYFNSRGTKRTKILSTKIEGFNLYKNECRKGCNMNIVLKSIFLNEYFDRNGSINEIWKPFPENINYLISNIGNVKSLISNRLLKQYKNNSGYIKISFNGKCYSSHILVATVFIPKPNLNQYLVVNHINNIKDDNRVENLEWCTYKENSQHYINNFKTNVKMGTSVYCAKLNEDQVKEIYHNIESNSVLAKKYSISTSVIYNIKHKKTWKHITKDL